MEVDQSAHAVQPERRPDHWREGNLAAAIMLRPWGLLASLAAAGYGASFVRDGAAGASLGMALATGVALLCYIIGLFVTGRASPPETA
jgi:hypothetical protein